MRNTIQTILILMLVLLFYSGAYAIPKEVKAKSEFLLAQQLFERKDFRGTIKHLKNAKILLNHTNGKIQFMLVKSYTALESYKKAKSELELYFAVTPESASSTDHYNEMVVMFARIEEGIKAEERAERRALEIQKENERARIAELAVQRENERKQQAMSVRQAQNAGGRWKLLATKFGQNQRPFPYNHLITVYQTGNKISFKARYQDGCLANEDGTETIEGTYINRTFKASFRWCLSNFAMTGIMSNTGKEIIGNWQWGGRSGPSGTFTMVRSNADDDPSHYHGTVQSRQRGSSSATCFIDTATGNSID